MITSLSAVSTLTVLLNCYEAELQCEAQSVKVDKEKFNDWNDIPSIIGAARTDADECNVCRNLRDTIDKVGASHLAAAISRYLLATTKPEWIAGCFAWMKISMLADDDCCANAVDRAFYSVVDFCRMNNNAETADWLLKCYDYLTAAAMLGSDLYASFIFEDIALCREVAGRVSDIVDSIEAYPTLVETFHKLLCRKASMSA